MSPHKLLRVRLVALCFSSTESLFIALYEFRIPQLPDSTMSDNTLIFYDIDSKSKQIWSPNTMLTKFALDYKGIPYTTQLVRSEQLGLLKLQS